MSRYLHTMIRVKDLDKSVGFYTKLMGMKELRRRDVPGGRYTLAFVGYGENPDQAEIELTITGTSRRPTTSARVRPPRGRRARRGGGVRARPQRRRQGHARGRAGASTAPR